MGTFIGIDLGTTYSAVSIVGSYGKPQIIKLSQNSATTPSAVYIDEDGEILIGAEAKNELRGKAQVATFYKRNIGDDRKCFYLEDGNVYSSVDLSGIFLKNLVDKTEKVLGKKIDGAVITFPAYFNEHQKNNTKKAAKNAGINVLHMINEPTAAAIAYGIDKANDRKILVYDLGGGTFDISIAQITEKSISIIGSAGDAQLGGKDWDEVICNWAAEQFEEQFGNDFSSDDDYMKAFMVSAESIKRNLSSQSKTDFIIKYDGEKGTFTFEEEEFRKRTRILLERTGKKIEELFDSLKITWNDIDDVILIGGSTRMRMVEDYIAELRNGKEALRGINPDEAVAFGAAIVAESLGNFEIIGNETTKNESKIELTADREDVFEIVAGDKVIEDVNTHSLGFITYDEVKRGDETYAVFRNEILVPKNTQLKNASYKKRLILGQDVYDMYMTQWEKNDMPELENIIGKYQVYGIKPNQEFDVTYGHNIDGTIKVTAKQNGKELVVKKVAEKADRTFEDELLRRASKGLIMMAVDLSASMSSIGDEEEANRLLKIYDTSMATRYEKEQAAYLIKYIDAMDNSRYSEVDILSEKIDCSSINMTKKSMTDFVNQFSGKNIYFGVVGFADQCKVLSSITNDANRLKSDINKITFNYDEIGIANEGEPLGYMYNIIQEKMIKEKFDFVYVIVLTDGVWDSVATRNELQVKSRYIAQNYEIIAQGFGNANTEFINQLATMSELSGVGNVADLGENMSAIAKVISDNDFAVSGK